MRNVRPDKAQKKCNADLKSFGNPGIVVPNTNIYVGKNNCRSAILLEQQEIGNKGA